MEELTKNLKAVRLLALLSLMKKDIKDAEVDLTTDTVEFNAAVLYNQMVKNLELLKPLTGEE